jgi:NTE family protein
LHIFGHEKISAEAVMASACLPAVFRAVEIDGVPYWDGGYLGNPVIYPFFRSTGTEDVLIVQINPLMRKKLPTSTREIMSRVNEITFNSSLMAELRAIEFVTRLIDQGRLPHGTGPHEYRRIKVHRIVLEGLGERFSSSNRLRNDYESFELLRKLGQRAARRFLDAHYDDVGTRSSIDLKTEVFSERR